MKSRYIFFKANFFKIFFFSLFLTIISISYEHYGWVINKSPETIEIGLFSTIEDNSVLCGGLPLPYAFEWHDVTDRIKGQPLLSLDVIIYKSIFFIDVVLWMLIITFLFSWIKDFKNKELLQKEKR